MQKNIFVLIIGSLLFWGGISFSQKNRYKVQKKNNTVLVFSKSKKEPVFTYRFDYVVADTAIIPMEQQAVLLVASKDNKIYLFSLHDEVDLQPGPGQDELHEKALFEYQFSKAEDLCWFVSGEIICFSKGHEVCIIELGHNTVSKWTDIQLEVGDQVTYLNYQNNLLHVGIRGPKIFVVSLFDWAKPEIIFNSSFKTDSKKEKHRIIRKANGEKGIICVDLYDSFFLANLIAKDFGSPIKVGHNKRYISSYPLVSYCQNQNLQIERKIWHVGLTNNEYYMFVIEPNKQCTYFFLDRRFPTFYLQGLGSEVVYARYARGLVYIGLKNNKLYIFNHESKRRIFSHRFKNQVVYAGYVDGMFHIGLKNNTYYVYDVPDIASKKLNPDKRFAHQFNQPVCCAACDTERFCIGLEDNTCCIFEGDGLYRLKSKTHVENINCIENRLYIHPKNGESSYLFDLINKKQLFEDGHNGKEIWVAKGEAKKDEKERIDFLWQDHEENTLPKKKAVRLKNQRIIVHNPLFLLNQ